VQILVLFEYQSQYPCPVVSVGPWKILTNCAFTSRWVFAGVDMLMKGAGKDCTALFSILLIVLLLTSQLN